MTEENTLKYSLIIVDDELKIRQGLQTLFPWNEYGYEVKRDLFKRTAGP